MCRVVAASAGTQCEMVNGRAPANMTGMYPILETEHGCLNESVAIAKYLADGHATLLGSNTW